MASSGRMGLIFARLLAPRQTLSRNQCEGFLLRTSFLDGPLHSFPLNPLNLILKSIHSSAVCPSKYKSVIETMEGPKKWLAYNDVVLPPQAPGEPRRAAQVFHMRTQIRYSDHHMWYCAHMIRGLSIDEALAQLSFNGQKGSMIIKEVLLEAQEMALRDHNFEFKTKMWVAESFSGKGVRVYGIRRSAKKRMSKIKFNFCHYFVKLEEGDPPEHYKTPKKPTMRDLMEEYMSEQRGRRVIGSL